MATITASEAARRYGYATGDTLNRTIRRWGRPQPVGREPGRGGETVYDDAELASAMADRPRPPRADLRRPSIQDIITAIADEYAVERQVVEQALPSVCYWLDPDDVRPDQITPDQINELRAVVHEQTRVLATWHAGGDGDTPIVRVGVSRRYELPTWRPDADQVDEVLAENGWRRLTPWRGHVAEVERA